MPVFIFTRTFDQIKEYRRLYVKEVFLYKKSDLVGNEFFVFAIYDMLASNKRLPHFFRRIDRAVPANDGVAKTTEEKSTATNANDGLIAPSKQDTTGSLVGPPHSATA